MTHGVTPKVGRIRFDTVSLETYTDNGSFMLVIILGQNEMPA